MKHSVVAVIVTYNRKNMLENCIHALQEQTVACDILIIDNGSTDGTEHMIKNGMLNDAIIYKNTQKNLGGAGGFNYGMKTAMNLGYEYIWLMDDDTYPNTDALEKILEADSVLKGKYGFLSSVAYWRDGSVCNMNRQKASLKRVVDSYDEKLIPVIMATFVSFFVKREIVRQVGYPIKEFFIWSDDLEYSRRISRKYEGYVVTNSRVLHDMVSNAKVGIEHETPERLWRYEYLYRNEVYLYRREGLKGMLYLFMRIVLHLIRVLCKGKKGRIEKIRVILRSFKSGFSFSPEIEMVEEKTW